MFPGQVRHWFASDGNPTILILMFILTMTTSSSDQFPTIILYYLNKISDFHLSICAIISFWITK